MATCDLSRRQVWKQIATVTSGALIAAKAMDAASDPLPSLIGRRNEIVDWVNAEAAGSDAAPGAYDELDGLEEKIFRSVAATRAGLLAQLRFLQRFIGEGFEFDDDCGQLVDHVIAGIERLGAAA